MANSAWSEPLRGRLRHRSAQQTAAVASPRRSPSRVLGRATTWSRVHGPRRPPSFSWTGHDACSGEGLDAGAVDVANGTSAACSSVVARSAGYEDLEAAAVGEDRAVPAHDRVQAAGARRPSSGPGRRSRWLRVGPGSSRLLSRAGGRRRRPSPWPAVPTGMKAGQFDRSRGAFSTRDRRAAEPAVALPPLEAAGPPKTGAWARSRLGREPSPSMVRLQSPRRLSVLDQCELLADFVEAA